MVLGPWMTNTVINKCWFATSINRGTAQARKWTEVAKEAHLPTWNAALYVLP